MCVYFYLFSYIFFCNKYPQTYVCWPLELWKKLSQPWSICRAMRFQNLVNLVSTSCVFGLKKIEFSVFVFSSVNHVCLLVNKFLYSKNDCLHCTLKVWCPNQRIYVFIRVIMTFSSKSSYSKSDSPYVSKHDLTIGSIYNVTVKNSVIRCGEMFYNSCSAKHLNLHQTSNLNGRHPTCINLRLNYVIQRRSGGILNMP